MDRPSALPCCLSLPPQIVGAILGSSFLMASVPHSHASALGSNAIAPGVSTGTPLQLHLPLPLPPPQPLLLLLSRCRHCRCS